MKKIILSALIISTGMLVSCEKESNNEEKTLTSRAYASGTSKGVLNLDDDNMPGQGGGCKYGEAYCVTFIIHGGTQGVFGLISAIDEGEERDFLTQSFIDTMNNQDTVIGNYLTGVLNGNAQMTYRISNDSQRVGFLFDSTSVDTANYSAAAVIDL